MINKYMNTYEPYSNEYLIKQLDKAIALLERKIMAKQPVKKPSPKPVKKPCPGGC